MMPRRSSSNGGGRSSQGTSSLLKTLISPIRAFFGQTVGEREPNPNLHSDDLPLPLAAKAHSMASKSYAGKGKDPINSMDAKGVKSPNLDYSHFVSLPLAIHPKLVEKLHNFQKFVLEEVGMLPKDDIEALGIDKSIFITPKTFHLTVLMLKLWNKDRIAMATEILKGVSSKVIEALENRPVSIRLRGLACMRGSPAKAYVVHIPVEEIGGGGRLLRACQVIIDAFVEAGLVLQKDTHPSLKLHATVMNAKFRKGNKSARGPASFDARGIFKRYGSEDWGKYVIPEAHLSQRFAYDQRGYYHCCASITFPGSIKT